MRVTIVAGAIDGSGGFRVIATLGQLLIARGHEVWVITQQPAKFSFVTKVKALLKGIKLQTPPGPSASLGALRAVEVDHAGPLTEADLPDADIVVATWWKTMEFVKDLPAAKGLKVHLVQDYEVWARNTAEEVDGVLRLACPKIAISSYLRDLLINTFGNEEVYLLPNAINHEDFFAPPREKGNPLTVGFTYSQDPRKGSDLVVKAVIKARETLPELQVLAFGHSLPKEWMPVPAWVEFHVDPKLGEIRALYSRCDAWLFGSRREGFGLPILEAMACRTPVIGMPAGAAPDLLGDGAGMLIGDQDWAAMAEAILNIAAMPDAEWRMLSDRAHHRAKENQWDLIGDRLEKILDDLLERERLLA